MEKIGVMTVSFFIFVILLFVSNYEKFEKVKASMTGVEIVSRAERVIKDAEVTMEQLRKMMLVTSETQLDTLIKYGRLGGYEVNEREETKDKIISMLSEIGISEDKVDEILNKTWNKYRIFDMGHFFINNIKNKTPEMNDEIKAFNRSLDNPLTPDVVESFYSKWNLMNSTVSEYLLDFKYFYENKKHRRYDKWIDNSWSKFEVTYKV